MSSLQPPSSRGEDQAATPLPLPPHTFTSATDSTAWPDLVGAASNEPMWDKAPWWLGDRGPGSGAEPEPQGWARAGGAPLWPPETAGSADHRQLGRRLASLGSSRRMMVLALIVGGSVLLLGVVSVLAQSGLLALGGGTAGSAPNGSTPSLGGTGSLGSPTTTLSPTLSAGWLQVSPSTVHLGCDDATKAQVIVLANKGPKAVRWQVTLPLPPDQAGVEVSPGNGRLPAGASVTIQLVNKTENGGGVRREGTLAFAPQRADAGPAAKLTYTLDSCG